MNWTGDIVVIAFVFALGVVIGDIEGVARGWLHALKYPPKNRFEIKPFATLREGLPGLSIKLSPTQTVRIGSPNEDRRIIFQWPQAFSYSPLVPLEETEQTDDKMPLGLQALERAGRVKRRRGPLGVSDEQKLKIVLGWDPNKMTQAEYCRRVNIDPRTYRGYREDLEKAGKIK